MEAGEDAQQQSPIEEKPSKHGPRKCQECGNEFIPKLDRAKYCSGTCRAAAAKKGIANNGGGPSQSLSPFPNLGALGGVFAIPPHAQMMIDHHKRESDRWEKKYDIEVADHKKTKDKLDTLKEEHNSDKNPGGLQGFAKDNPEIALKLIDIGGQLMGKLGDRFMGSAPSVSAIPEAAGLAGQASDMVRLFAEWLPKISEQSQQNVWQLIEALAQEDEEKMNYYIRHIMQQWKR